VNVKHFVNHADPAISTFVAGLISEPYVISKIWSRHDNHPETEEMKIKLIVPKTVLALKYKKVDKVLQNLSDALKNAQEQGNQEEEDELLRKIIEVSALKREISRHIGARTIQPL
jgi:DNA primase